MPLSPRADRAAWFSACDQGGGVAPGTALGSTAVLVLYNPANSGKRLVVRKVSVGYVSGTIGAGTLYHCVNATTNQTAPSSGTLLTNLNCDAGSLSVGVGVVRTGATVVQPVAFRPFVCLTAELATTAAPLQQIAEDLAGEVVLEPGTSYQLQAVAAGGSSPKLTAGLSWQEVPLAS